MKKTLLFLGIYLIIFGTVFAAPAIDCGNLPGCGDNGGASLDTPVSFIASLIAEAIKYVAVIAVIALMLSGILYLISGGEEEKVKKAKTWIIWSLVGGTLVSFFVVYNQPHK